PVGGFAAGLAGCKEEGMIAATVRSMVAVLRELADDYEVIVVNDGSRDATAARVEEVAREAAGVRLVSHPVNRGYGSALASGFTAATKDWIFLTDGDKQFDVRGLGRLVPGKAERGLGVGYREPRRGPLPARVDRPG